MTKALDESLVRDALRQVRWPDVAKDIVACGLLKKIEITADRVKVSVEEPTMVVAPPVREAFETQIRRTVESVAAGRAVDLETSVRVVAMPAPADKNRLPRVKNVIAVASGKGGVGKSTVATNLALALQKWGARVGMVDCDIFGPSVPQMLGVEQRAAIGTAEKKIAPALYFDMPVMSVAFFVEKADAVVWRGPMVHKLLTQFMEDVEWGELDYLVVDLPPGTGDVQLSLSQLIPLSGAVMVTTPQTVAILDVVKGISMFRKVEVPILGIVENMAYYDCPKCGHHDEIFSRGGGKALAQDQNVPLLAEIPIDSRVRAGGDNGFPIVAAAPDSSHGKIFMDLATQVAGRLVSQVLSGPRRVAGLVTIR